MEAKIPLPKLENDVYSALKLWHEASFDAYSLGYLYLFQPALQRDSSNTHQVVNEILDDALEALAIDYQVEADLLRKRFVEGLVMNVVAKRLHLSEAAAYRKQKEAIKQLALILQFKETQARSEHQTMLEQRLPAPTYTQLIGIEDHLDSLLNLLSSPGPPWVVSIEGLGGLGKTSLANAFSRQVISDKLFDNFGWVSARQQIFNPGGGIKPVNHPKLTVEKLVEELAAQLIPDSRNLEKFSFQDTLVALRTKLKQGPHLIVIDNLETVIDIESLLPTLLTLVAPTKFLLTSRESLYHETGIHHFSLPQLNKTNALQLIRNEARLHNLPFLVQANNDDLNKIFEIVGGNPLALRLVVGQAHVHSLDVILNSLAEARGQKAEMLYTFIYRQAWDTLDELTRRLFLAMPLVTNQGGSLDYLVDLSGIDSASVCDALDRLVALNLVDSKGDLHERRYTIHSLTRTFLHEQVVKWQ